MVQLIASLTINEKEPEALQAYFETVNPLIEAMGGKVLQRIDVGDPVVGEAMPRLLMVVEYPSREAIQGVFESEAYKSIIPARKLAFSTYNICLVEDSELNMTVGVSDVRMPVKFE